jgi:hypothetical protein
MKFINRVLLITCVFCAGMPVFGQSKQQKRAVGAFENVSVNTTEHTDILIQYAKVQQVIVKVDNVCINKIKTFISGETLNIYVDKAQVGNAHVQVLVYTPRLVKVSIVGEGNVEVLDALVPSAIQAIAPLDKKYKPVCVTLDLVGSRSFIKEPIVA